MILKKQNMALDRAKSKNPKEKRYSQIRIEPASGEVHQYPRMSAKGQKAQLLKRNGLQGTQRFPKIQSQSNEWQDDSLITSEAFSLMIKYQWALERWGRIHRISGKTRKVLLLLHQQISEGRVKIMTGVKLLKTESISKDQAENHLLKIPFGEIYWFPIDVREFSKFHRLAPSTMWQSLQALEKKNIVQIRVFGGKRAYSVDYLQLRPLIVPKGKAERPDRSILSNLVA